MKKLGLSAAALAGIASALYLAAQRHPDLYPPDGGAAVGLALLITTGPAPESGDGGLAVDWPDDGGAIATEAVVHVPVDADHLADTVIRTVESYPVPRGSLPDGITTRLWPEGAEWGCAIGEPGQACEALKYAPGEAPAWAPCNPCQTYRRSEVRGVYTPAPCNAPSEVDRHAAMTPACRAWLADAGTN